MKKGFIPDAVKTDEEGHKMINYTVLIPLLVQSVQDLTLQIEEQKSLIAELSMNENTTDISFLAKKAKRNRILNYTPNPTKGMMTFTISVEENKSDVYLVICNLSGVQEKRIDGITAVRDESNREGVRFIIEVKRDASAHVILNNLFKLTQMQTNFSFNMLAIQNGVPKILSLREILLAYIEHQKEVVTRRTIFDKEKAEARAHILAGLLIALDHIDEVIRTIRASKTQDEAEKALIEKFGLSVIQAKAILAMQLRRLTGLEREAIENELAELRKKIAYFEKVLADESEILRIIKEELLEIKEKYGDDRRSKIINTEVGKFSDEELIPEEDTVVLVTTENYIKRTLASDYRRQNRGGKGKRGMTTKEEDVIDQLVPASTHDWLLFFTNKGRVFRLKAYEVPAASLAAKGVAAVNLLQLQPEEKITSIINLAKDAGSDGYLFMATTKCTVKKTAVSDYANIRTNGLIAINLDDGDELRWIKQTDGKSDVIISTSAGQAVRFNEEECRPMGRAARGVRGVWLRPNDSVVGMDVVASADQTLLVLSANGYGKITKVANFPSHKRGGVGIKAATVTAKTGPIVTVQTLESDAVEAIIISQGGQTIRVGLGDIPTLGRTTQGVRVMRLSDDDSVSSIGIMRDSGEDEG